MKKSILTISLAFLSIVLINTSSYACTNFLITKGATVDGSTMISYSADSHVLFGELYHWPAADYPDGTLMKIYEWDTGKYLGEIPQAKHTYNVVGNMNENQVAIGETTYTGREELQDTTGLVDYGSLIYIALQRSRTAREAIQIMTDLVSKYGYYSTGESFSISDANEVWIMELIGKGPGVTGAVWVARMIPDGYISGHANHARITTFPFNKKNNFDDPKQTTFHAADVISFAREKGYYTGSDADFSFSDVYAPLDFGGARFCEARVFSGFNKVNSQMGQYLDYAMGKDLKNRMPLWVKVDNKLTVHDVMQLMRDYYQNTPMDMTQDIGAGPYKSIVRWRPMTWEVDGVSYLHERAISTQQTGFSFVAQSRGWLPNPVGGIIWFGVDDTYSTVYTPMYCGMTSVPETFAVGNGSIMEFSDNAAFWVFNQVSNFAYTRYSDMIKDIQPLQEKLELGYIEEIKAIDKEASELYQSNPKQALEIITNYSVKQGNNTVYTWKKLYAYLFTKYMDGNIKQARPVPDNYKYVTPTVEQPGYDEEWYRMIVKDNGEELKVIGNSH
ncbi:MAG: peptidase C69 [Bacteroidetes bacterium GWC2_33_15]|nr:MAG: peptidase C69 [Bacteroidetes bacterium GWA2_33_15]OFX48661.1 MAG: peptidase C69 [Bacteroidetes bacterium GWC2_33_15]OFX64635.1 MAG: peptidase C69 [Bacteroidetes bacterium GWB2_32_14]OFX67947.1 MAG: peptidase C69 [Bacteroidetes bacterium GWD2_33_33]HAN18178.1 dipeptidase [Bacteroidales bacterium]